MSELLDRFRTGARGQWRDRPAIVTESGTTTYAALAAKVDQTGDALLQHGFTRGDTVLSCLWAGESVAVTMLATWLVGGVYVPISPALPAARERVIADGVQPRVVLRGHRARGGAEHVTIESQPPGSGSAGADPALRGLDAAYMIHTSGSTGRPKGVIVTHANLATLAESHESQVYARFAPDASRVSLNNPPETDASFSELVQLAYGRTLHLIPWSARRAPALMADFLERQRLEVLDATPSQVRGLLLAGHRGQLSRLSLLMVGGEEIDDGLWHQLADLPMPVVNLYGPTECTVDVTVSEIVHADPPNVGHAFPGTVIRILGEDGNPVPVGEVGEICVSGAQVAAGYLGGAGTGGFVLDEQLGSDPMARSYHTGDRGRRLPCGKICFMGRVDDQVKVRGHRVELGDVEAAVREHAGVRWACVAVEEEGLSSALRAFVVLAGGVRIQAVSEHVSRLLPSYAVPTLHRVEEIPMAPTGKVDRAKLLAALRTVATDAGEASDPHAETRPEQVVRAVWLRHAGVDAVADEDDFFTSGGTSIAAAMLTIELRDRLLVDLAIDSLYRNPTFGAYQQEVTALLAAGEPSRPDPLADTSVPAT